MRSTPVIVLALGLAGAALASTASAQIVCELCTEMQPGWEDYVVTSEQSPLDCRSMTGSAGASRPGGNAAAWQRDARRVAAVAFGRLPRERADDSTAGTILRQMTVVLETDTDAIVLAQIGQTERRACMMRAGVAEPWMVIRLDVADLSRPAPAAKP